MFLCRVINNRINHFNDRALGIIYRECNSYFTEPLRKDSYLTIRQRNLKLVVTEVFNPKIAVGPDIMKHILEIDPSRHLRA